MVQDVDILVIGGGLIGMALLHALKPLGLSVRMVEAQDMQASSGTCTPLDTRSIALSPASIRILKQLNCWQSFAGFATEIHTIHVSEQGRFGQAKLHRDEDEPLGAVVEINKLYNALKAGLDAHMIYAPAKLTALDAATGLTTVTGTDGTHQIQAKWVIGADGTNSFVRKLCGMHASSKHYTEHALAANILLSRTHHQVAYERFTPTGPLALLPLRDKHMALVWTLAPKAAEQMKELPKPAFLYALQRAFGYRAGRIIDVGPRATYPLKQVIMRKKVCGRVVFIGNAAQTLHPVAGQGFNLGLRDVATLAEVAAKGELTTALLASYEVLRAHDQKIVAGATDGLVSLFQSKLPGASFARRMGLVALDNQPFLKKTLLHYAKGFGGIVPELVCKEAQDV